MLRIHEIKLRLEEDTTALPEHIKRRLELKNLDIVSWTPIKESIDARDKGDIRRVYSVDFSIAEGEGAPGEEEILAHGISKKLKISVAPEEEYHFVAQSGQPLSAPPVVVGFGPCGMFAGLLLAQMGYCPIVLERGKEIEKRAVDVEAFWKQGVLNPESNVQFGEGGAGAFSDGKLTTQIKDTRIRKVLTELAAAGGGEELLYKQKPHMGTDVLMKVVKNIREEIIRLGGRVEFENCLTGLILEGKKENEAGENTEKAAGENTENDSRRIVALEINGGDQEGGSILKTNAVVLALGHSARDTLKILYNQGIKMEQKSFSMGVRIEHPQQMINEAQYGKNHQKYGLGAADYKLSYKAGNGRGVYTFCMCPGGRVIASASESGGVVTNGMSYRDRSLRNANSALLVDVRPADFESEHPLAGLSFQEKYEKLAFSAGGRTYHAPAQRVGDFLSGGGATGKGYVVKNPNAKGQEKRVQPTYQPGVTWADLRQCLPDFVVESLREALPEMGKKLRGFDRPDAVLTGVETRSSSPVRIPRGDDLTCGIEGIYPGGEGAGFAGGITSAAVDGIRIAEAIAGKYTWEK